MKTVAITLFVPKAGLGVWNCGANQNVLAMWLLLRAAGYRVLMVNGGDGEHPAPASLPPCFADVEYVRLPDVVDQIDVLIESGAQVSAEHVAQVRARGGVAIGMKFGNNYAIDGERTVHDKPAGSIFNGAVFDFIATTSQHEPTCGAYWELSYRCPVVVWPHVWTSAFVEASVASFPAGVRAGYQPGRAKKRIASFEPNINLIKTATIPMLCAEAAYRKRPDLIERVLITNAEHLRSRLSFSTFASNLDICRVKTEDGHAVCTFESRYQTPWFMAHHADLCVSHQWISVPNYCHYDLISLGYPLVHNVPELRDAGVGFYYEGFDARQGGDALIAAMTTYDRDIEHHRVAGARFLETVQATAPANVEAHRVVIERFADMRRATNAA